MPPVLRRLKTATQSVGNHFPSLLRDSSMEDQQILTGWLYLESSTVGLTGARGFARLYPARLDVAASEHDSDLWQHLALTCHSQLTQLTRRHFSVRQDAGHAVWATVTRRTVNKVQLVCTQ